MPRIFWHVNWLSNEWGVQLPFLACCLQSVALQRKSCISEHIQFMFTPTLLGAPLLSMQQKSLMGISPYSLLPVRVWPSLVPRPRPAFRRLQHGKALPYCKRRKAGWGLGTRLSLACKTKVRHGWTLLIKMAEATLIVSQQTSSLDFYWGGTSAFKSRFMAGASHRSS